MRRRVRQSEIAAALAEMFPRVMLYAQQTGLAPAGPLFARYLDMGPDVMTMEAGVPVAASARDPQQGQDDVVAGTLPGGLAAVATHMGPYDRLRETHAALQQWVAARGLVPNGAPWESYVTDPGEHPDPKDWKTEVICPVAAKG